MVVAAAAAAVAAARGSWALPLLLCAAVQCIPVAAQEQREAPAKLSLVSEVVLRGAASRAVAWSPDGRLVASSGPQGEVLVVDVARGVVLHELLVSDYCADSLCFSPDSRLLVVVSHHVSHWDPRTGLCVDRHEGHSPIAFSDDGRWLAFCVQRGVGVRAMRHLSPTGRGADRVLLKDSQSAIRALRFAPGGRQLVLRRSDGGEQVLSTDSWEVDSSDTVAATELTAEETRFRRLSWRHQAPIAMSSDCRSWVVARRDGLTFHGEASGREAIELPHRCLLQQAEFTGDGKYLAVQADQSVRILRAADCSPVKVPAGLLQGKLIRFADGPELVLWQLEGRRGPTKGHLNFWSVDALARGRRAPVRTATIEVSGNAGPPMFSTNGRFVGLEFGLRDAAALDRVLFASPDGYGTRVQPGEQGRYLLRLDPFHGCTGESSLFAAVFDSAGRKVADEIFMGLWFGEMPEARRSPDGRFLLALDWEALHLLSMPKLQPVWKLKEVPHAAAWLGNDSMLLLGGDDVLDLVWDFEDVASRRVVSLPLPAARTPREDAVLVGRRRPSIVVDPRGRSAAIVWHDRITMIRIQKP